MNDITLIQEHKRVFLRFLSLGVMNSIVSCDTYYYGQVPLTSLRETSTWTLEAHLPFQSMKYLIRDPFFEA